MAGPSEPTAATRGTVASFHALSYMTIRDTAAQLGSHERSIDQLGAQELPLFYTYTALLCFNL